MEEDKKVSASNEENPKQIAENVQQEAESTSDESMSTPQEEVTPRDNLSTKSTDQESANDSTESHEISQIPSEVVDEKIETSTDAQSIEEVETPSLEVSPEIDTVALETETVEERLVSENIASEVEAGQSRPEEIKSEPATEKVEEQSGAVPESSVPEDVEEEAKQVDEFAEVDLDGASKKELLDWLKKVRTEDNFRKVDHLFKDLGTHFEEKFGEEKKEALDAFLVIEGNEEGDFKFSGEEIDKEFHALYEEQKLKRSHFFHQLEKQKEENLTKKEQILDMMREIVDGEDQTSFNRVKKLQDEWKQTGPVPGAQNRTLWANYHALMDRFYDKRTIYFELKDLDRKKNLQAKIELVEKAEALDVEKDLKSSIIQLNEIHEEYKHVGPVPKEEQEPLWQRLKAASDRVYEQRKESTEQQKEEHKKNLEIKQGLTQSAEELANFTSDRIKEWNQKTKDLLELQKTWEAGGGVPRDKARAVNRAFWGNFKKFFANKNKFFKSLDAQRGDNLKLKQELIAKAIELKVSKDFENTTNAFKDLQNKWKEIGPVPEKFRKRLYEKFKGHCDEFFDKRRGQNAEQDKKFEKNLEVKQDIMNSLEELSKGDTIDLDQVYELTDNFSEAGLVSRNMVGKVLNRYDAICKKILTSSKIEEGEKGELQIHFDLSKLKNSPHGHKKINRKEQTIRRKINGLENDVNLWRTNLDFFAKSKNADQLKSEFEQKIVDAEKELVSLKQQLRHLQ